VDEKNKLSNPKNNKYEPSSYRGVMSFDLSLGCIRRFDDLGNLWKSVMRNHQIPFCEGGVELLI
jgi:hypothetical protein